MNKTPDAVREEIVNELEAARSSFHSLLASLSESDFQKQSRNPGWTNGEILAHMTFGFLVINVLLPVTRLWGKLPPGSSRWFARLLNAWTGVFNWFNRLGAKGQGKVFTRQRIGKIYDGVHLSLLKKAKSIQDHEWGRGMYYPTNWDSNFDEFMSLEKLFHYPVIHFNFHREQIAR